MTDRRHHGHRQRRIRGSDAAHLYGDSMPPNSDYWRGCARGARNRLARVIGDAEADRQIQNIQGTWKETCEAIELLADLAEHQQKVQADIETMPGPAPKTTEEK